MRSQALHGCVTSICVVRIVLSLPRRGGWGGGCFFFLVADSQWTSIYILLDRFLFLYRKRWWVFHHKEKKKKEKKTWEDIPISEILESISEERKKSFFIILFFPSSSQPSSILSHPIFGPRGEGGHTSGGKGRCVVFGWLFYFILFYKSSFPRVLEQNAGICRA